MVSLMQRGRAGPPAEAAGEGWPPPTKRLQYSSRKVLPGRKPAGRRRGAPGLGAAEHAAAAEGGAKGVGPGVDVGHAARPAAAVGLGLTLVKLAELLRAALLVAAGERPAAGAAPRAVGGLLAGAERDVAALAEGGGADRAHCDERLLRAAAAVELRRAAGLRRGGRAVLLADALAAVAADDDVVWGDAAAAGAADLPAVARGAVAALDAGLRGRGGREQRKA
ncbi:MAG: hypothetical protein J3K34DRAFT_422550 [Monoraphidium minutum]|nr:MAG: hypothetical protein J3K34DRAFT_422550 [Monoraphidium minutum]